MAKKRTSKKRRSGKSRKPSFLKVAVKWLFVLGLWTGIAGGLLVAWYAAELPEITKNVDFAPQSAITIKAADGSVLARYGEIRGESVTVEDLPPHLIYAVLATEDRRFYSHFGIDPVGLARAMAANIKAGRFVQGGSTITQQLAKNLFLSQERTIKRKIQEAILAFWLERELTKDEILSAYLNRVYLGSGTFGVDAAARLYFDKPVSEIDLREAALLAGLLKAPSRYSPRRNPDLARRRTDVVLGAMADAGYITSAQAQNLKDIPPEPAQKPETGNSARYFTDWVVDGLDELIGTPEENIIIETTFNPDIQNIAHEALHKVLVNHGEARNISQGAAVVMRPNGAVLAMVGGANYFESQFNRAVQARRQPGSAFKPFVYLTGLQYGLTPQSLVNDAPIEIGRYRPKNFGNQYYGEVMLENALALSLNTVSFQIMKETGPGPVIETARNMGIYSPLTPDLSLALGTSGVSLLELATAYSVLANGGLAVYPYAITKITNEDGELYYSRPRRRFTRRVAEERHVESLTYMMEGVLEYGTGQRAKVPFPAAGKTGTSQDSRDAWFMGFTNELVAGVWLGNDDNEPMDRITGGGFPAAIWQDIMLKTRGRYRPISKNDLMTGAFDRLMDKLKFSSDDEASSILWRTRRSNTEDKNTRHENQRRYND